MSKFSVGDKVKVVANTVGHDFEDHEHVTIVYVYADGTYRAKTNDSEWWRVTDDDVAPIATTPPRFEIGKTYKTVDKGTVKCVYIHDDGQALCFFEYPDGKVSSAYIWNADGTYASCIESAAGPYRIVFEPVVEWVDKVLYYDENGKSLYYTIGVPVLTVSYPLIDDEPDWTQAKVTPV